MKKIFFAVCFAASLLLAASLPAKEVARNAKKALAELKEGNTRFATSKLIHPDQTPARRMEIAAAQNPKAVVLSCSDSRVPPEIIFDQGLGDIFVVRVAGNVLNDENIGSIEYAAEHAGAPLVIVLGHKRCGAVTATVKGEKAPGHIESIVSALRPAVDEAKKKNPSGDTTSITEEASHINVHNVVNGLKRSNPILATMIKEKKLAIIGAYYDLDSGKVEWMKAGGL